MQVIHTPQAVRSYVVVFLNTQLEIHVRSEVPGKLVEMLVAVGHVSKRRDEKQYPRRRFAFWRPHEEGHIVAGALSLQAHGINATLQIVRNFELEVCFPVCVFKVVVMEVDGAIFVASLSKVRFAAGPVVTGYGARRQVDEPAV